MQILPSGKTDLSLVVRLFSSADGTPATGLTIANLQIRYIRNETDNDVTISAWQSLTALTALTDAHTDNKGYEIGEGYYRIDVPNAVCAAGASEAVVLVQDSVGGTINVEAREIQLDIQVLANNSDNEQIAPGTVQTSMIQTLSTISNHAASADTVSSANAVKLSTIETNTANLRRVR